MPRSISMISWTGTLACEISESNDVVGGLHGYS